MRRIFYSYWIIISWTGFHWNWFSWLLSRVAQRVRLNLVKFNSRIVLWNKFVLWNSYFWLCKFTSCWNIAQRSNLKAGSLGLGQMGVPFLLLCYFLLWYDCFVVIYYRKWTIHKFLGANLAPSPVLWSCKVNFFLFIELCVALVVA